MKKWGKSAKYSFDLPAHFFYTQTPVLTQFVRNIYISFSTKKTSDPLLRNHFATEIAKGGGGPKYLTFSQRIKTVNKKKVRKTTYISDILYPKSEIQDDYLSNHFASVGN